MNRNEYYKRMILWLVLGSGIVVNVLGAAIAYWGF